MKLRRIKHMLLRLSMEEKVLGIGSILVLVGSFLPWFSVAFNFNETAQTDSAFTGDLGVIGFVIFLLTAMTLGYMASEHLSLKLPRFGFKKEQLLMFLTGQTAFLLLLNLGIYTKRSFLFTNAEIRFGLWMSIIGAFAGAIAAFAQIQRQQKSETKSIFDHSEEIAEAEVSTQEVVGQIDVPETEEPSVQKSFFYEEDAKTENEPVMEEVAEEVIEEEQEIDEPYQEPAIETIQPEEVAETVKEELQENQGGYFMREAGVEKSSIKVDLESVKKVEQANPEKSSKPQPANQSMDFYEDI